MSNWTKKWQTKHISEKELLDVVIPLCSGLEHVHQLGVIHRDIHGGNVILKNSDFRKPVIVDFGTARDFSIRELEENEEYQTFQPIGAMSHRAPEKWMRPYAVGPESDVFSLGAMMYWCLSRQMPYRSEKSYLDLYRIIESGQHIPVRKLRQDVTEKTSQLIDAMIDPDLLTRVSTVAEVRKRAVAISQHLT